MYHSEVAKRHALVAQLDRVSDYESEGLGFESLRAHQEASLTARFFRVRWDENPLGSFFMPVGIAFLSPDCESSMTPEGQI